MSSSAVDICNLALAHLGDEAQVIDINPPDGSIQAAHCGRFYPIARDALLEMHQWTFATVRVSLALVADAQPSEWAYAYALPAKYLKALSVLAPDARDDAKGDDYVVESTSESTGLLYTNTESAQLRYIQRVEDTTKFTAGFVTALGRLLASYLAGPIVKGTTGMQVAQAQTKFFLIELANARTQDSNTGQRSDYSRRISSIQQARGGPAASLDCR